MKPVKIISAVAGGTFMVLVGSAHAVSGVIKELSIGANGVHGTLVELNGASFPSGCGSTTNALVKGSNANYQEMIAALLAAKITENTVWITTGTCGAGDSFWPVKEVQLR